MTLWEWMLKIAKAAHYPARRQAHLLGELGQVHAEALLESPAHRLPHSMRRFAPWYMREICRNDDDTVRGYDFRWFALPALASTQGLTFGRLSARVVHMIENPEVDGP